MVWVGPRPEDAPVSLCVAEGSVQGCPQLTGGGAGSHHRNLQIPPDLGTPATGRGPDLWLLYLLQKSHGIVQPGSIGAERRAPQGEGGVPQGGEGGP